MYNMHGSQQYRLIIKHIDGTVIKQRTLNQSLGLKIQVQFRQKLELVFSLMNKINYSQNQQCYAQGCAILELDQINNSKNQKISTPLYTKNSNTLLLTIQYQLKLDDEKIGWHLDKEEQMQEFEDDSAIQRVTQKVPHRYQSSVLKSKYKKDKVRHLQYKVRDQLLKGSLQVNNKINGNCYLLFQNFKLDCNQVIEYIGFRNCKNKDIFGEIFNQGSFNNYDQQLSRIVLKCPIGLDQLQVMIKTKEKNVYKMETFLDDLYNKEVKAVGLVLRAQRGEKKGKFWFNYKIQQIQENNSKMVLEQQKQLVNDKLCQSSPDSIGNKYDELPNTLRIMQIFEKGYRKKANKRKITQFKQLFSIQSPSPVRKHNKSMLTSKTIDEMILPFSSPKKLLYQQLKKTGQANAGANDLSLIKNGCYYNYNGQNHNKLKISSLNNLSNVYPANNRTTHQKYASLTKIVQSRQYPSNSINFKNKSPREDQPRRYSYQKSYEQLKKNWDSRAVLKNTRSKTIQHEYQPLSQPIIYKKYNAKITQIDIKFYTSYVTGRKINVQRDSRVGKFLQIYTTSSQIYRSDMTYGSQHLSWILKNCEIQLKHNKNLVLEVCSSKDNKRICSTQIGFEQLKYSFEQATFYKGHIMKDNEYIAKIIIVFSLKTNEKVEYVNLVESKKPIHINELQFHSPTKNTKKKKLYVIKEVK